MTLFDRDTLSLTIKHYHRTTQSVNNLPPKDKKILFFAPEHLQGTKINKFPSINQLKQYLKM